ncbi:MAG: transcription antitermination factor NusB, partial [Bacteroidetes bacterium]|nr:transcription antitermination factor NusB [Bacteroidota bacterium]
YMMAEVCSFHKDKEIFISIFKKIISHSEILQFYYEEKNIYWSDDFFVSNLMAVKAIKSWEPHWDEHYKLPVLFETDPELNKNEDMEFILNLFRKTILRSGEYDKLIENKVQNWEIDRIAVIDIILIKMALVELMESPSIPVKVTLNEYIELAKLYSTPKSKVFVNGILDKLIFDLTELNLINKVGRGLMEV